MKERDTKEMGMKEVLWKADLENGRYRNPILYADYSDPDAIRVGDTYYMTASSFNYTPGLPILKSKDLVNWKLVSYALENIPWEGYEKPAHARGVWAPAIRYHEGEFYIYYGMPDEGIFMIHTEDPEGVWSDPVLVLEGKGLIDPCPLWEDNGKAWVVHGYAKSRIGFNSILGLFPMSWDGTRATGEDTFIFDGTKTQPTIEGPKIYVREGRYYIFAPAGGVKTGWQTVLRADDIKGPYEEKIVMKQGDTPVNGPHQGALVEALDGREWFLHFQDRGSFGRITHLQPVQWTEDGWPVIGGQADEDGCGRPLMEYEKPFCEDGTEICYPEVSDDFTGEKPGIMWQWSGNHNDSFYSMRKNEPGIRIFALPYKSESVRETAVSGNIPVSMPLLWDCPNLLTQKLPCPEFSVETKADMRGLKAGDMAGVVVLGGLYAYLGVLRSETGLSLVYAVSEGHDEERQERVLFETPLESGAEFIKLAMALEAQGEGGEPVVTLKYSVNEGPMVEMIEKFSPAGHTWVGARFGLFAVSARNQRESAKNASEISEHGFAEFSYVTAEAVQR